MQPLRLAYATLYVISLVAFFFVWGEVGGSSHLDLMPWHLKLVLGAAAAYAFVRATAAAVAHTQTWNSLTMRWAAILLSLLISCGVATYYYHLNYEDTEEEEEEETTEVQPAAIVTTCGGRATLSTPGPARQATARPPAPARPAQHRRGSQAA